MEILNTKYNTYVTYGKTLGINEFKYVVELFHYNGDVEYLATSRSTNVRAVVSGKTEQEAINSFKEACRVYVLFNYLMQLNSNKK